MSQAELIDRLTGICIRQAEIIKAQAEVLEQVGAMVMEEERADIGRTLTDLIGHDETPDAVQAEANWVREKHRREAAALAEAASAKR